MYTAKSSKSGVVRSEIICTQENKIVLDIRLVFAASFVKKNEAEFSEMTATGDPH